MRCGGTAEPKDGGGVGGKVVESMAMAMAGSGGMVFGRDGGL